MTSSALSKMRVLVLAAIAVVALAVAGCGGSTGSTSGGSSNGSSETGGSASNNSATPEKGGTMTVAEDEEADTLDPMIALLPAETIYVSQISEPLFRENLKGEIVPWLVEKVKTSKGQRVWTLSLKSGIKFSTGKPMTSADVLFTLERAEHSTAWKTLFEGVSSITAPNSSTIVITNKEPAAELPTLLSQWSFGIEPKNLGGESEKEFAQKPIGTGPFMVASWKRGEALTLEANPYYWQPGRPYLEKLIFHTVPDANSRVSQLQGGEINVAYSPPWSQVESIENSPETHFEKYPLGFLKVLYINSRKELFQNENIREAINLALDREAMVQAVLAGHGEPAASIVPPAIIFHDVKLKAPEQNMAKAKELVEKAESEGMKPEFTFGVPNEDDFWETGSQVVQQNLEEAGFTVKIQKYDVSTQLENLTTGNYDIVAGFVYSGVATPTEIFGGYNSYEAQFTGASTKETTKLFNEALSEVNETKRAALYAKLQEIVANEKYVNAVAYVPFSWATQSDVTGLYVGRVGIPWFSEAGFSG
jgi:peptide/nickel transport system substrate-binding protein